MKTAEMVYIKKWFELVFVYISLLILPTDQLGKRNRFVFRAGY